MAADAARTAAAVASSPLDVLPHAPVRCCTGRPPPLLGGDLPAPYVPRPDGRRPASDARRPLPLRLPDLESGETSHGHAGLGEDLLDRLLLLLHERLLGEHDVLEVGVDPAFDDLGDRLVGLALVAGDLLRDPALL